MVMKREKRGECCLEFSIDNNLVDGVVGSTWSYFLSSFLRISVHLYAMFEEESPSWDVERKYKLANMEVQCCSYKQTNISSGSNVFAKTKRRSFILEKSFLSLNLFFLLSCIRLICYLLFRCISRMPHMKSYVW